MEYDPKRAGRGGAFNKMAAKAGALRGFQDLWRAMLLIVRREVDPESA